MKLFLDTTARPATDEEVINGTTTALEWQTFSTDPPGVSYTYVFSLDPTSFVAATCWGHEFDRFCEFIFHPQLGKDWISAYGEAWPTFGALLTNAARRRYADPSLVNFPDPADADRKWCVAAFIGNTTPKETYEEVANDPRVGAAAQLVMLKSLELLAEMGSDRKLSGKAKMKLFAKGMSSGKQKPVYDSTIWLDRVARMAWR